MFRFVHTSNPTQLGKDEKRLVRSHASREAYAKIRRARVASYLGLSSSPSTAITSGSSGSSVSASNDNGNDNNNSPSIMMPRPATTERSSHPVSIPEEQQEQPILPMIPITTNLPAGRADPFDASVTRLRPMESFLLDHYIRVVIPSSTELCQSFRIPGRAAFYRHRMTVDWIPLALGDIGLLAGVLLAACRHLAAMYMRMHATATEKKDMDMNMNMDKSRYGWQELSTLAIQYKLVCLRSLTSTLNMKGDAIKKEEGLGDLALAKVIALGIDEIAVGNLGASRNHLLGAIKIADLRGGLDNLGLNGLLAFIMRQLINENGILGEYNCFGKSYDFAAVV